MFRSKREQGFSLVEIAIVLGILGLVFVGFSKGLGVYHSNANLKKSHESIHIIKEQLFKFAEINKYLPCPDTDGNGSENRTGIRCANVVGTVPYLNIGKHVEDVQDPWGNNYRYAVNADADDAVLICDKRQSASMFCNAGSATNTPWFTLTDTPPLAANNLNAANNGNNNYTVCNENTATCTAAMAGNNVNIETNMAVAVLVAYNQDGATTLGNCAGAIATNNENCDADLYYHQANPSNSTTTFFDDEVVAIEGYEVKKRVLSDILTFTDYIGGSVILPSTYEAYDLDIGDDPFANTDSADNTGDDVIRIRRNVSAPLDLGQGDDLISIGKDLTEGSTLDAGEGNDTVFIGNAASSAVILGEGDDSLVLRGEAITDSEGVVTDIIGGLTSSLLAGDGEDKVWIQGSILEGSMLDMGDDDDVLWLGHSLYDSSGRISTDIDGGTGYDILILENMTKAEWNVNNGGFQSSVLNFEYVMFEADADGNREHCEIGSC